MSQVHLIRRAFRLRSVRLYLLAMECDTIVYGPVTEHDVRP